MLHNIDNALLIVCFSCSRMGKRLLISLPDREMFYVLMHAWSFTFFTLHVNSDIKYLHVMTKLIIYMYFVQ